MASHWHEQWRELVRTELGIVLQDDDQDGLGLYPDPLRITEFCEFFERHPELRVIARAEIVDCILGSLFAATETSTELTPELLSSVAYVIHHAHRSPSMASVLANHLGNASEITLSALRHWLYQHVDDSRLSSMVMREGTGEYGHSRDAYAPWDRLRKSLGGRQDAWDETWDLLDIMHRTPRRCYHTLDHICECLDALALLGGYSEPTAVLALFFHDAIYVAGSNRNELASAQLAHVVSTSIEAEQYADDVCDAILATQHKQPPSTEIAAMVTDADLSILAATSDRYTEYTRQIRHEWKHVVESDFRSGREQFIRSMLQRERIYWTESGQRQFEEAARANLKRELQSLTAD